MLSQVGSESHVQVRRLETDKNLSCQPVPAVVCKAREVKDKSHSKLDVPAIAFRRRPIFAPEEGCLGDRSLPFFPQVIVRSRIRDRIRPRKEVARPGGVVSLIQP